jgi:chitosanase
MTLTQEQITTIQQIVNVFETGSPEGDYAQVTILKDGPGGRRQVTYGRSQTTEYGNLRELVDMYIGANGAFASQLRPFLPQIGNLATPLVGDVVFTDTLRNAGLQDPIMKSTQDIFFDNRYFQPAVDWADANGFTKALSLLVIYDSFIHSGRIHPFLRKRFSESPPARGGDEKAWIKAYTNARHDWLGGHSNRILRNTVYRTQCFLNEMERGNWDLDMLPIPANGTAIGGSLRGMVWRGGVLASDR